jgi:hypothetical protein
MKKFILILLTVAAIPSIAGAQSIFNCSSGFSTSGSCGASPSARTEAFWNSSGTLTGSAATLLTTGEVHRVFSLNYQTAVNDQAFKSTFNFMPDGQNISFFITNNTNTNAGGAGQGFNSGAGCEAGIYQAFAAEPTSPNNIFALELDSYSPLTENGSFTNSSAQIYQTNQSPCLPNDTGPHYWPTNKISTSPIAMDSPASRQNTCLETNSGTCDTYSATIIATGTNLTLNLYDVTAGGTCSPVKSSTCFTYTWNGVNVPALVDGTTGYVGIVGATGLPNSWPLNVVGFSYTVLSAADTPTCSLGSGTYGSTQSVTCSDSSPDSTICYNFVGSPYTDGNGNCPNGTEYTQSISVAAGQTLYLVAGSGSTAYGDSTVGSYTYNITGTTAQPTFSLSTAAYQGNQTVIISDATSRATIYYTTDGSMPTTSSSVYSTPLTISSNTTLKAIGSASGTSSAVSSATYTINPFAGQAPANSPTFSPPPETYSATQSVTLASTTPGSYICYTLAASPPSILPQPNNMGGCQSGTLYSGPVSVSSSQTLYAIAGTTFMSNPSSLVQGAYTIGTSTGGQTPAPPTNVQGSAVPSE